MRVESKRKILKALVKEHGKKEAYDIYGEFIDSRSKKCTICNSSIYEYSEWQDTGYEIEACENGCYCIETHGLTSEITTKGFIFKGKVSEVMQRNFEKQIKNNANAFKREMKLFWKKKKTQKKSK